MGNGYRRIFRPAYRVAKTGPLPSQHRPGARIGSSNPAVICRVGGTDGERLSGRRLIALSEVNDSARRRAASRLSLVTRARGLALSRGFSPRAPERGEGAPSQTNCHWPSRAGSRAGYRSRERRTPPNTGDR
jgi:hypothetical protein